MTEGKTVLVTGVASYWGERVAVQLIAQSGCHVIGLDAERPKQDIKDLDFIQADIRNPLLVDLLKNEAVDTVCHLAWMDLPQSNETSFDYNVMGTMKVFGACAEAGVRKIVVKSSMAAYGANPTNSAFLKEATPLQVSNNHSEIRDTVEMEAFCNGFRRQAPEVMLTILRFPNIVGPTVDSPFTRYLKAPLIPILLGFDPMMQVIHENDVVGALEHAVTNDCPGVYNVAAEEVLPLMRIIGIIGKLPIPILHPVAYLGVSLLNGSGLPAARYVPMGLDYIRYPWVGDISRMRDEMGFQPHYTAGEALREFAGVLRMSIYRTESANMAYDEERLRDTIERRRRARVRSQENAPYAPAEEIEDGGIYDV